MRLFLPSVLLIAACGVDLNVPSEGAYITCTRDAQCPEGFRCAKEAGYCLKGVAEDTEGPALQEVVAKSETSLMLSFSERLGPRRIEDPTVYSITPALTVIGATLLEDEQRIALTLQEDVRGDRRRGPTLGAEQCLWRHANGRLLRRRYDGHRRHEHPRR